ncbi:MAG TPA: peptidoglycan editing factor PgeF [Steroidobacteraceae bacterium]|nr:peptidoglycan editing factor PgeF [Steroidobacteraceae bacterium]
MNPIGWVAAEWPAPPGVFAGVTTRAGGVSAGPFATLNLATRIGDDPGAVATNRARLKASLALPAEPLWLRQMHGTAVVVHDGTRADPEADAAVAFEPGRVLAVLTADCLPVVIASRDGARLGLAHAGWRGLAGGVIEATVRELRVAGADLVAWLGPGISAAAFEVGAEVRAAFTARDPAAAEAFTPNRRGRWQADLYHLARQRLAGLGIQSVSGGGACTFADAERFYSFRRDASTGRMATLAWLVAGTAAAKARS